MRSKPRALNDDRPMKEITVDIEATTTLNWDGGEVVVSVPEGASEQEIHAALVQYLMTQAVDMDWAWEEKPEIGSWEIVEDELAG
jgi:hypothetical protein